MKRFTVFYALFLMFNLQAQTTITHSVSQVIDEGSPSCTVEGTNYLRVFDLENEFNISNEFEITNVEFGIWTSDVSEEIIVNLYTSPTTDIVTGPLTLIYSGVEFTTDGEISMHTLTSSVIVEAGSIVVFELEEAIDGVEFRIGANELGQTGPSWIKSDACGFQTVESTGFVSHFVVNVIGNELTFGIEDANKDLLKVSPNPTYNMINLELPSFVILEDVGLYDLAGRNTNLQLIDEQMNLADLPNGLYVLKIDTSLGPVVERILKQ